MFEREVVYDNSFSFFFVLVLFNNLLNTSNLSFISSSLLIITFSYNLFAQDQDPLEAAYEKANAKLLILGHYSTRYKSIELFKKEAQEVFPVVELADDGKVFDFDL